MKKQAKKRQIKVWVVRDKDGNLYLFGRQDKDPEPMKFERSQQWNIPKGCTTSFFKPLFRVEGFENVKWEDDFPAPGIFYEKDFGIWEVKLLLKLRIELPF